MQYQTFPDVKGDSRSLDKLKALRLPALQGKRFLDVGCNEGFFCGYAQFDGAAEVVGIDKSREAVIRAQARFPDCRFIAQSWDQLPDGKFDVILLASALHYAEDQEELIHRLMSSLTDKGTLVLEIGISPSGKSEWVKVERSIDERLFPTQQKLSEILSNYAWKTIGHSVQQAGDPLKRFVVHVSHLKPFVFLLLEPSGYGKTTLARTFFAKANVPVISGDLTFMRVAYGRLLASEPLTAAITEDFSTTHIDKVTNLVLSRGLTDDLVELWCQQVEGREFVLDSFVPEKYQKAVKAAFVAKGYVPVSVNWDLENSMAKSDDANNKAELYVKNLLRQPAILTANRLMVTKVNLSEVARFLSGWHLDHPVQGQAFVADEQMTIAGWGLPKNADFGGLQCYVRSSAGTQVFKLDQRRPDVIKARLSAQDDVPEEAFSCGFKMVRPSNEVLSGIEIGFIVDGQEIAAARVGVTGTKADEAPLLRRLLDKARMIIPPRR